MFFTAEASNVSENILSYFHFKRVQNQRYVGRTKRKSIQNKKETEKLTFKAEIALMCHHQLFYPLGNHPLQVQIIPSKFQAEMSF